MSRFLERPYLLWLFLSLPGTWWLYAYWQDEIFYGEMLHYTGELAAHLLIVTLAVTPLGLMFPGKGWVRWLKSRRRYLGVAVFAYAMLHTLVYIQRRPELAYILEEARTFAMWSGWLALLLFLIMAATSNNLSVGVLGKGWKQLHRVVYVAAVLTFVHWILTAFDPVTGIIHLGVLVLLVTYRLWRRYLSSGRVN
jgi:sulfoxide reductase heme-binding subunit YedZ